MTGFTLPGMIEEPGWQAGSSISRRPVRGPELKRRRSLQILIRSSARLRSTPDIATIGAMLCIAANRSGAMLNFSFSALESSAATIDRYFGWAFRPVPVAVPPIPRTFQVLQDAPVAGGVLIDDRGVGVELLTQSNRDRVL